MATTATAETLKQLILIRVGENDPNGTIAGSLDVLWDMHADKALIAPRLQFLYTLAEVMDIKVAVATGTASSQEVQAWMKQRDSALEQAHIIEKQYSYVRATVSGTLTTTAPISPADDPRTVGALDANDRLYRGDAYLTGYPGSGRII